jgi:hypothetical protein
VAKIGEPILVILMKEVLSSSETSVLTRAIRRNIPEDAILYDDLHHNGDYKNNIMAKMYSTLELVSRALPRCQLYDYACLINPYVSFGHVMFAKRILRQITQQSLNNLS